MTEAEDLYSDDVVLDASAMSLYPDSYALGELLADAADNEGTVWLPTLALAQAGISDIAPPGHGSLLALAFLPQCRVAKPITQWRSLASAAAELDGSLADAEAYLLATKLPGDVPILTPTPDRYTKLGAAALLLE